MKKILFFASLIFLPFIVNADAINDFKMDIYIDNNGDAYVTETWDATADMGSEFYHSYYNYGKSEFDDFNVTMDGTYYTFIENWDLNGSLDDKAYKNGFNYVDDGIELCFGKTKLGRHTYISKYKISNFVLNTTDSDIVYWTLLPHNNGGQFKNVYVKIHSDFKYEDTLDVWGYGNYGGTSYVYDGYIEMTSEGALSNSEYMTVLIKFPLGTFTTTNKDTVNNFNYYYQMAENGATHYEDDSSYSSSIGFIFRIFVWIVIVFAFVITAKKNGNALGKYRLDFGKRGKKLSKDIPNYRDIPCNKDMYIAYFISTAFNINKNKTDLLGAVLLKWLKEDKIIVRKANLGLLETNAIDLKNSTFNNELETQLYDMMKEASKDGILESREFENWCKNNYKEILKWFEKVLNNSGEVLEENNLITKISNGKMLSTTKYLVNDKMYDEAAKVYGLKKFLLEFSKIDEKMPIEVKLWEEYLIYAQIFGIAREVATQFKKLYPEILENNSYNYDFDTILFVNNMSYASMVSASTAKARAESYSSGGGGFSSGGGGGGSFGGGGGGGAGGR